MLCDICNALNVHLLNTNCTPNFQEPLCVDGFMVQH